MRYSLKTLKQLFKDLKEKHGLPYTPKASLIKNYCTVQEVHVIDPVTQKRGDGYKILSFLN